MDDAYVERIRGIDVVRWNPPLPDGRGRVDNFGDLLGPAIVERLATDFPLATTDRRLVAVGSILQFALSGDVVWGSGINAKLRARRIDSGRQLDVRAVRGPLTALALEVEGNRVPAVYGDPALLLPEIFPWTAEWAAPSRKRRQVVEVPNVNDLAVQHGDSVTVLSPRGDPWVIIEELLSAELVVGSSLHAIVVAEAFGVPARLIRSNAEHVAKYVDYYAGTGRAGVRIASSFEEAVQLGGAPAPVWDAEPLLAAFPADLWRGGRVDPGAPARPLGEVAEEIARRAFAAGADDRDAWVELARRSLLAILKDRADSMLGDDLERVVGATRALDSAGLLDGIHPRLERTRALARLGLGDRLVRSASLNGPGYRAVLDSVDRADEEGVLHLAGTLQLPDESLEDVTVGVQLADDELGGRKAVPTSWTDADPSTGTIRWQVSVDVPSVETGTWVLVVRIESDTAEPRDCIVQSAPPLSFPRWWAGARAYRVDRTKRGNVVLHFEDPEAAA